MSFSVREGEILGIVGESGSGKTTVGRAVVGLTMPSSGRVVFRGGTREDRGGRGAARHRRAVQMVFQDPYASLNPRLSVFRTLAEPLRWHRLREPADLETRVLELMASVELPEAFRDRASASGSRSRGH
ncbi:MAG: ATP-binding cassette domain-containing protein [Actinobacteria bacterium]|nr:ATP-binding cassette domain-containing protein [Actinomycetota bacterium]